MDEIAQPDQVQAWSPAPDKGQAGTVMLEGGQWAYRYKDGAEPIIMKMPERPAPTYRCSSNEHMNVLDTELLW